LEKVVGPGQAIVRVSADINFDTVTRTEEKFDPDGSVVRTQTKGDENNDSSTSAGNSGLTGITPNTTTDTTNTVQTAGVPLNNSRNRKTTSTVEYENAKSVSNSIQAAGGIKRLTAAVTVAAHFEGQDTDRKVAPRSPAELEKLRRIVQSAVGIDAERGDQITL